MLKQCWHARSTDTHGTVVSKYVEIQKITTTKKRELLDQMKKKRHAEDKCSESQRGFLVRAAVVASLVSVQALLVVCSRFTEIKLYRKIAQNK